MNFSLPRPALWLTLLALTVLAPRSVMAQDDLFGSQERNEEALIGILYDFKMNQKREPTGVDPGKYTNIINEFLGSGWQEGPLNRYFRATRPIYATQIFIPLVGANAAPKAFGVDKVVSPRLIAVHYKGQVLPPHAGTYRFAGYGDDILAVAVDGKTVLIGARFNMPMGKGNADWVSKEGEGARASNGRLTYGDWLTLTVEKPIDIDVLVGERPGGQFSAFLMYQEKGVEYDIIDGHPVLPVFQLAKVKMPETTDRSAPLYAPTEKVWKAVP